MRFMAFSERNRKELLRDPLTLIFMVGLPVALLGMMRLITRNMPPQGPQNFAIDQFAPAMAVFSLSFLAMFLGMLIANDKKSAFLSRLFTSPLRVADYVLGYTLPMLAIALLMAAACLLFGVVLGLALSWRLLLTLAVLMPVALLFIGIGVLIGAAMSISQVTVVGNILIQLATLLGGTWFSLELLGGAFESIGYLLPFAHAVDLARAASGGRAGEIWPHLLWVLGYAAVFYVLAVLVFRKKMKR